MWLRFFIELPWDKKYTIATFGISHDPTFAREWGTFLLNWHEIRGII